MVKRIKIPFDFFGGIDEFLIFQFRFSSFELRLPLVKLFYINLDPLIRDKIVRSKFKHFKKLHIVKSIKYINTRRKVEII